MSDLKTKYEYVECKHPKLYTGIHQLCWHHNNVSADRLVEYIYAIERQLATAHREGWEQCKMECAEVAEKMTRECPSPNCSEYTDADDCMYKDTGYCIAAAIRRLKI